MDPIELIEKGKLKRFFRSRKKLTSPGLIYHITQRAAGKEPLFLEKDDYMAMLALLKDICENHKIELYAFCLMPNHIHLLLSPREKTLPESMKKLFSNYASRFNRKYQRKGHLFGGPYRQAVCLDDAYILAASIYIHVNPVRAGIVKDALRYRWASTALYVKEAKRKSFVNPDLVLSILADGDRADLGGARKRYIDLLRRGSGIKVKEVLEMEDAIEDFLFKLKRVSPFLIERVLRKKKSSEALGMELASLGEIEDMIETVQKNRNIRDPQARDAKRYLIEQLLARGYQRKEIAQKLRISRKTVYNILRSSI